VEIRKSGDDAVRRSRVASASRLRNIGLIVIFVLAALPLSAREKNANDYGVGLIVNVPFPEAEVVQVVQEVIQNGLIRGTKEYNKDEYVTGANSATFTRVFPRWTEGGEVFYKVRLKALDPRNFKDSSDLGTLAVRYVVQPRDEKHAVLRIDARFVEDFRRSSHPSNGSVESAEYKDIHDHLEALELMRAQTVEAEKEKQEQARQVSAPIDRPPAEVAQAVPEDSVRTDATSRREAEASPPTLEQRVQDLRRQVQRLVKAPGAPLQSAPFHTATTLRSLPTGTEVLIVVSTAYWYGVETHEGQHGWILRDELELIP
jgi:polyhydroxyalkanoate synthesis regulator phasin